MPRSALKVSQLRTTATPLDGQVFLYDSASGGFRTATPGTAVVNEVPSGTVDGLNVTFTLANTPNSGTLQLYLNGSLQHVGAANDYTLSDATITFNIPPNNGATILASYNYGGSVLVYPGSGTQKGYVTVYPNSGNDDAEYMTFPNPLGTAEIDYIQVQYSDIGENRWTDYETIWNNGYGVHYGWQLTEMRSDFITLLTWNTLGFGPKNWRVVVAIF